MNIRTVVGWISVTVVVLCAATPARAAVCDLTGTGSTCSLSTDTPVIGDVLFEKNVSLPTNYGYIDPFLQIQNSPTESGYNTKADYIPSTNKQDYQLDQKNPTYNPLDTTLTQNFSGYTHDLLLSSVPIVTISGVAYREFWLDINESGGTKLPLSLDSLQIFLSANGGLGVQGVSDYNSSTKQLAGLSAIYDLDAGGDNYVKLNYNLGAGPGDMTLYVPDSLFTGGKYVYLYSRFGLQTGLESDGGFEEWWVRTPGRATMYPNPEPASLLLFGSGLVLAGMRLRKRTTKNPNSSGK